MRAPGDTNSNETITDDDSNYDVRAKLALWQALDLVDEDRGLSDSDVLIRYLAILVDDAGYVCLLCDIDATEPQVLL